MKICLMRGAMGNPGKVCIFVGAGAGNDTNSHWVCEGV